MPPGRPERMKGGTINERVQLLAGRAGIPYIGGKKVKGTVCGPADMIAAGVLLRDRNRRGGRRSRRTPSMTGL